MPAYGWKPSLPDQRNLQLHFGARTPPASVDLTRTGLLPSQVWDQLDIGSCVAHASGALYVYVTRQEGAAEIDPSRLFVYYNGRLIEDTVSVDSGLTCSDGIKSLVKYGAPPEADWPYVTAQFRAKPPEKAYADGATRQALTYAQVQQSQSQMQACLAAGSPFIAGFSAYASLESDEVARTGMLPMPGRDETQIGGHCVLCVGYEAIAGKLYWKCLNSWGRAWGDQGFFYLPAAYLTSPSLAGDFWTLYTAETGPPTPTPPTPTPPTPVPPLADAVLYAAAKNWMLHRHVGETRTVARALTAWATEKGLLRP